MHGILDAIISGSLVFIWLFFRKFGNTNIVLRYLLLKVTGKRLKKKKALFGFSNKSGIQDFNNIVIILFSNKNWWHNKG